MSKDTFHDTTNATVGEKIVYHYPTMFNSDQAFWIRTINEYFKKELKSTPIPIQNPCGELEKEVERLKGENKDLIAYTEYVKRITDGGEWPMTYEAYK